jgi:hypothetical protein
MSKRPQAILAFLAAAAVTTTAVGADSISYALTSLGGNTWEYSYSVANTDEVNGLSVFDIYFPSVASPLFVNYTNITEVANPNPLNWQTTIFPPSAPNLGAIYDAHALTTPIALGQSVTGFEVSFMYNGAAQLGAQTFEIYDPHYNLLQTGSTTPMASVPEPYTLALFGLGLAALSVMRVRGQFLLGKGSRRSLGKGNDGDNSAALFSKNK